MEPFSSVTRLFERHPELMYVSLFIALLCAGAFGYLLWAYLRKNPADPPPQTQGQDEAETSGPVRAWRRQEAAPPDPGLLVPAAALSIPDPVPERDTPRAELPARRGPDTRPAAASLISITAPLARPVAEPPQPGRAVPSAPIYIQLPHTRPAPDVPAPEVAAAESVVEEKPPLPVKTDAPLPSYPLVCWPVEGRVVRHPRHCPRPHPGPVVQNFQGRLERAFRRFTVSADSCLPTPAGSRPFEPALTLRVQEGNEGLYIAIEIDLPYASHAPLPLHTTEWDAARDRFFCERGWMVVRFTERQVVRQPDHCLAFIARLLAKVFPNYTLATAWSSLAGPAPESRWTAARAQQWADEKYREQYLGIHSFGYVRPVEGGDPLLLTEEEAAAEAQLADKEISGIDRSALPREERLRRKATGWTLEGVPVRSARSLAAQCLPVPGSDHTPDAAVAFGKGLAERFPHLRWRQTQWTVVDEVHLLAGTVDGLADNGDGSYDLYGWLDGTTDVEAEVSPPLRPGAGFHNLAPTPYHQRCLELALVRWILEERYDLPIRQCLLVRPDGAQPEVAPDLQQAAGTVLALPL